MKKSVYIKRGNAFIVTDNNSMVTFDTLPAGNYTVNVTPELGFHLVKVDDFVPLTKYYGNTIDYSDRIMNTFLSRPNSTGVALSGDKGSGKSLLAKQLSIKGYDIGIPTVLINHPYFGDGFNRFVQDISCPCIIVFDEFEKIYNWEEQKQILTLFDGVYPSKKLFVITTNERSGLNSYMLNRPGRIFYNFEYKGLEPEFIKEYCEDNLNDQSHIETLIKLSFFFDSFNFDLLKAIVEEMNRYNESPQDVLKFINAKPESSDRYDLTKVIFNNEDVTQYVCEGRSFNGSPLMRKSHSVGFRTKEVDEDGDVTYVYFDIIPGEITKMDIMQGIFEYDVKSKDGHDIKVTVSKAASSAFNYLGAL